MVELRKRKTADSTESEPLPVKKTNSAKSTSSSKMDVPPANDSASTEKVVSGSTIELDGFGGEIETQEGVKTTLKKLDQIYSQCDAIENNADFKLYLVDESKNGVVLFTYPKASTPGCTTQACLFRDEFTSLTSTGFSIYGLSTDSPKSNTNFKSKQNLPYTLLCDPAATLITAIGMKKTPSGTIRGVFVVSKDGKVHAVSPGGPAATVDVVRKLVEAKSEVAKDEESEMGVERGSSHVQDTKQQDVSGDEAKAKVAAEVADTAEQLDDGPAA